MRSGAQRRGKIAEDFFYCKIAQGGGFDIADGEERARGLEWAEEFYKAHWLPVYRRLNMYVESSWREEYGEFADHYLSGPKKSLLNLLKGAGGEDSDLPTLEPIPIGKLETLVKEEDVSLMIDMLDEMFQDYERG